MFTYTGNYFYNISKLPLSPILMSYMNRIIFNSTYDWIEQFNDIQLINILKELQFIFRIHWTQFNDSLIFFGILLTCILLLFRLLIRHFLICREELNHSSICRSILDPWISKSLNKLNPIYEFHPISWIRVTFACFMLIICLRMYWRLLFEYLNIYIGVNQSNKVAWRKLCLFILIGSLLSLLWMVDSAESTNWIGFIPKHKLHTVRIWIARIFLMTIFYIFFQLLKSPFQLIQQINFIKSMQSNDCNQSIQRSVLYLYTLWTMTCLTVLPLLSLLVFLNEFHIIWLVFMIIFVQIRIHATTVKCNHMDKCIKNSLQLHVPQNSISWIIAIFLCLLDNLSFFITGHQPTLSGIPWDAAYAAYEGDHNTRWLPGLTVLLHLYSGPILIAFIMHYSQLMKSTIPDRYRYLDVMIGLFCRDEAIELYWLEKPFLKTLGCMLSTGLLRRHLMVWKIFAPRLLFSILSLFISVVCLPMIRFLFVYCFHNRICNILQSKFNINMCV
ncbi:unnamed protein product [Schistosoma mattheei]|uniref:Uncharacterized protein n=1 Tax=Schistosoma mattheei TaxID=31246 RepID=A0A183NV76_9TREM|nr:unnamed protein product [Schistosoma mattheei]